MATEQVAVRVPKDLLAELDELVKLGRFRSRAEAVRAGIEIVARIEHRRTIDRAIVDGYEKAPPTTAEEAAALASLRDAIAEEPW